jgi:hypothetical protein
MPGAAANRLTPVGESIRDTTVNWLGGCGVKDIGELPTFSVAI